MQALSQNAMKIWMVKPALFYCNPQTVSSNSFQRNSEENLHEQAMHEFENMVELLSKNKVQVIVSDHSDREAPDAIFPNNWISFHHEHIAVKYPMMAENRRKERNIELPISPDRIVDFTSFETEGLFLEGTGSIVFDHVNRKAYACESSRTDFSLLSMVCDELNYIPVRFTTADRSGLAIYHTNVVMHIGYGYVLIALDALPDRSEKELLLKNFAEDNLVVIEISVSQMEAFAGNMLQVMNSDKQRITVCSRSAYETLDASQIQLLEKFTHLLPINVSAIELLGGGSVRCMMAEIF